MKNSRQELAEVVGARLDPAMSALGIIFALIVLIETVSKPAGAVGRILGVVGWVLWAIFVIEFLARMVIAPSKSRFLRKNWWQVAFLLVPFLRVFRLMRIARLSRAGRVLSSSVRASRSAGRALTSRVGWLLSVTVIVVLASSQILYEFADFPSYGEALYQTAMTAITGNGLTARSGITRIFSLALAVYSVVVFASLAAILGSFFMAARDGKASD